MLPVMHGELLFFCQMLTALGYQKERYGVNRPISTILADSSRPDMSRHRVDFGKRVAGAVFVAALGADVTAILN